MSIVDAILYKKINPGDLWNIDRPSGSGPTSGGGQTYINLAIDDTDLEGFLKYGCRTPKPYDHKSRDTITISASTLGSPMETSSISFDPRSNRNDYTIANQHKYRHPAWTTAHGFPSIPPKCKDSEDVRVSGVTEDLVILIFRTTDGIYIASYTNYHSKPSNWKKGIGLKKIFSGSTGILNFKAELELDIDSFL
ncbi:hypothetical protein [Paenibacillus sp. CGMCC 1.18879]|uniref:hypothetical protein n=1 Tax=Paenibacillus sp. CGMCC 1.18879 TaxID=2834466 RepID=UPI001CA8596C|nr:hypothetical protein [Paenibacillus sp. CGMCC 1.18879]MBY9078943.1 hypothetical protein [Paenibacillus sp. CGMCC 1.18879]